MIALVDYGAGNLTSVRKALAHVEADVFTPVDPAGLTGARGLIVPGVGHFSATAALHDGWRAAIASRVADGTPLLGICVGMQWLFEGSTEAPDCPGLGLLPGTCTRLADRDADGRPLKVPHVGWNSLVFDRASALTAGLDAGLQVYFTHSYAAPLGEPTVASTTYGNRFSAAVQRDHVFGVQFHPEKSSDGGLTMLRNFLAEVAERG